MRRFKSLISPLTDTIFETGATFGSLRKIKKGRKKKLNGTDEF